jgi:hypothetical protein
MEVAEQGGINRLGSMCIEIPISIPRFRNAGGRSLASEFFSLDAG